MYLFVVWRRWLICKRRLLNVLNSIHIMNLLNINNSQLSLASGRKSLMWREDPLSISRRNRESELPWTSNSISQRLASFSVEWSESEQLDGSPRIERLLLMMDSNSLFVRKTRKTRTLWRSVSEYEDNNNNNNNSSGLVTLSPWRTQ